MLSEKIAHCTSALASGVVARLFVFTVGIGSEKRKKAGARTLLAHQNAKRK